MLPKWHILLGAIFSFLIWIIFPQTNIIFIIIIFLASVLIDFDHYLIYALRKKDLNLKNSFNYFLLLQEKYKKAKNIKAPFSLLHTIEVLFILGVLSIYIKFVLFIFIGFLFHSFIDVVEVLVKGELFMREYSFILYLKRRKKGRIRYIEYE